MSNFNQFHTNEEELTSPSSDEKMDTGSESFRSQDTPNSIQSSDFEDNPDQNVLRLQNPDNDSLNALRTPEVFKTFQNYDNQEAKTTKISKTIEVFPKTTEILKNPEVLRLSKPELNDGLLQKMSNMIINSPKDVRPKNLGISPPKFSSTLTLTTNHPLMGLGSPEDYPDVVPKKLHKIEDEKDLSLSSIEDQPTDMNNFYSPQRNTSKNNLYFSENFVTADSHIFTDSLDSPPDVARVEKLERRKIVPKLDVDALTPQRIFARKQEGNKDNSAIISSHSTPKPSAEPIAVAKEDFRSGVTEWCDSPSQLRAMPNFDLPIEMSSSIGMHNDLESPGGGSSVAEERSAYQALLDPYSGCVALKPASHHTTHQTSNQMRRKIMLPPEDDRCSLDSISASSMESEEEPPEPEPGAQPPVDGEASDDDDTTKRSTNTISYSSEPIPEYSLGEELSNERGWLAVHSHACDVKVIEPYKRVVSHGGYSRAGAALIVFSACHLPDCARHDYSYVMDNLFLYVIWSLERLVTDEYILVYLHGSAGRRRLPTFGWLHECYKLIDRRLRKSLKHLYLVHPTFWLKSFVLITKPFVSSKFFKKLSYVKNLEELMEKVPVDPNAIPDIVKQYDAMRKS